MQRYATTDELAARYRVTVETIRAWARRGEIPSIRVGRHPLLFDIEDVDRWLKARDEVASEGTCDDQTDATQTKDETQS